MKEREGYRNEKLFLSELSIRQQINYKVVWKIFVCVSKHIHTYRYTSTHPVTPAQECPAVLQDNWARFWDICQDTLCLNTFPRESLDPWLQAGSWGASLHCYLPGHWWQRAEGPGIVPQTNTPLHTDCVKQHNFSPWEPVSSSYTCSGCSWGLPVKHIVVDPWCSYMSPAHPACS